jgi:hypothetical protein
VDGEEDVMARLCVIAESPKGSLFAIGCSDDVIAGKLTRDVTAKAGKYTERVRPSPSLLGGR